MRSPVRTMHEGISPLPRQQPRQLPHGAMWCHVAATGGPAVVLWCSATVDRRWPPLTATVDCRWPLLTGGGSDDGADDNWKATWHQLGSDTCPSNDWYEVPGLVRGGGFGWRLGRLGWWLGHSNQRKSILEAHMATTD
ncbi:hypothetical protein Tco_1466733 [Tanacetum coccineum]